MVLHCLQVAAGLAQDQHYEQHEGGGYHSRVLKKLQKLPMYAEQSNEDLEKAVNILTEVEPFRERYDCFLTSIEETSKGYAMDAAADSIWIEAERLPLDLAWSKVEERYDSLCKFPVKLVLRVKPREQVPAISSTYGAQLDTALLMRDHIFEWDSITSLVIPQPVDLKRLPPVLVTSVLSGSEWATYVSNQRSKLRTVSKSPPHSLLREEIDLLFRLTSKKDDLVTAVFKTVVDYNRNKQYNERTCNNHHFIQDMIRALGITKLPEVEESLGKQLEKYKQSCLETLPRTEFMDHADLDGFIHSYRDTNALSQLNIRDVEYLLGKYFQFHVRNWELAHHPEHWMCRERDCQLRHVEELLEKQCALVAGRMAKSSGERQLLERSEVCSQWLKNDLNVNTAPFPWRVECGDESPKALSGRKEQHSFVAGRMAESSGKRRLLEKLQHSGYAHKSYKDLQELAHQLTDFEEVFHQFSHLFEPAVDKAIDEALFNSRAMFTHSDEVDMVHTRAKHNLALVFHLPVKLFLSRLNQPIPLYSIAGKISKFFLEYGAFHAGLVVGNIRIEWGPEDIVEALPESDIPSDDFVGTIDGKQGYLADAAIEIHQKFSLADRLQSTEDKIKLIIDTAEKKKEVLSNLVRVIVHYNLEKTYDLFACNCQHFVRDALAALGIREPPRFSGQLNNYLERLKQGKVECPEDFKNHSTLDAYVEQQLQAESGTLSQHDMEYLLLHYYRIHLNSMPEDATDEWRCDVPTCKYEHLADRVNHEALLSNQFMSVTPTAMYLPITLTTHNHRIRPGLGASLEPVEITTLSPEEELRRREEEITRKEERREQMVRDEQRAREVRWCIIV